jgi:hypothetical protein
MHLTAFPRLSLGVERAQEVCASAPRVKGAAMVKAIGETIPMQKADSGSARYAFGCDRKRAWPAGASRPLSDGRGAGVAISNFPRGHSVGHRYWAELDAVPRNGTGDPMASPSVLERKGPARDSLAAIARRCWRLALRGARSRRRSAIDCLEALRSAKQTISPSSLGDITRAGMRLPFLCAIWTSRA